MRCRYVRISFLFLACFLPHSITIPLYPPDPSRTQPTPTQPLSIPFGPPPYQVVWTKFSPPNSGGGSTDTRPRREREDERVSSRMSTRMPPPLTLFFCAAESEDPTGTGTITSAASAAGAADDATTAEDATAAGDAAPSSANGDAKEVEGDDGVEAARATMAPPLADIIAVLKVKNYIDVHHGWSRYGGVGLVGVSAGA